jgi:hypothetical protein
MKTIVENATGLSKYIFEDDTNVVLEESMIKTPEFHIADLNSNNATLIEGVTPPEGWVGNKYTYVDGVWSVSSAWVEPEVPETV